MKILLNIIFVGLVNSIQDPLTETQMRLIFSAIQTLSKGIECVWQQFHLLAVQLLKTSYFLLFFFSFF